MLTCKICNTVTTPNLVAHIEDAHGGEDGLAAYIQKYGPTIDCVIHPSAQKAKGKTPKFTASRAAAVDPEYAPEPREVEYVEIAGVKMQRRTDVPDALKALIPKVNPAYHFPAWTAQDLASLALGLPLGYVGHTGTGKTSWIMQVAARIGQPVIRTNLNQQTTISDFVGTWGVKGGETVWIDGALPRSMRDGIWFIADEVDYGEPAILSCLNAVTEREPALMLKEKDGEVVVPSKHWHIFVTGNTLGQYSEWRHLYQGTNLLNEAWLDRIRLRIVTWLPEDVETKVLVGTIPKMTEAIAKELVRVASLARAAFLKEELSSPFSPRRLLDWGAQIIELRHLKAEAPFVAAETTIFSKVPREDQVAIDGFMRRILLNGNKP